MAYFEISGAYVYISTSEDDQVRLTIDYFMDQSTVYLRLWHLTPRDIQFPPKALCQGFSIVQPDRFTMHIHARHLIVQKSAELLGALTVKD